MNLSKDLEDALERFSGASASANDAACDIFAEILRTNRSLAQEAALVRETTTLLLHLSQNFRANLSASGCTSFAKPEVLHDV
jgi:hypothetical protein